jgi:hypothetical protein
VLKRTLRAAADRGRGALRDGVWEVGTLALRAALWTASACRGGRERTRRAGVHGRRLATGLVADARRDMRRAGSALARSAAASVHRVHVRLRAGADAARDGLEPMRGRLRRAGGTARAAGRDALRRALGANGPLPAAAAIAVFVLIATFGRSDPAPSPAPGAPVAVTTVVPDPRGRVLARLSSGLRDDRIPEERRVAAVEKLARDSRDVALEALLAAAESPSVVVSMAGVRALRGRPCARVGDGLVRRLSHADWQRRAWAAKVLGENGCVAAAPALQRRLRDEADRRVRTQLAIALATLGRGTPG